MSRERGRTVLRIRTDWDTVEDVVVEHQTSPDPTNWFLYRGDSFRSEDWEKILDAAGRLRPNTRASAWVCSDGSNPVVDWNAAAEP